MSLVLTEEEEQMVLDSRKCLIDVLLDDTIKYIKRTFSLTNELPTRIVDSGPDWIDVEIETTRGIVYAWSSYSESGEVLCILNGCNLTTTYAQCVANNILVMER